jgi:hypothetical protein
MSICKKTTNLISNEEKNQLSNKFFIVKNIIFLSRIPRGIFSKEILIQKKFLGQYGHINQLYLINNNKHENSVIAQFDTVNQAALSIIALNNFEINKNQKLKISYYYSRYCHSFLNNKECKNLNCLFIHSIKINDYLYKEIQVNEYINSFLFALNILDVSLTSFQLLSERIIGEKYFENKNKFPKITVKKLKNEENFRKISLNFFFNSNTFSNNILLKKNQSKSFKNSMKKLDNINKERKKRSVSHINLFKNIILNKRTEKSRFLFVKKIENKEDKVNVPDFVINIIAKLLNLYLNDKTSENNNLIQNVNNINFNANWSDLLLIKNLW